MRSFFFLFRLNFPDALHNDSRCQTADSVSYARTHRELCHICCGAYIARFLPCTSITSVICPRTTTHHPHLFHQHPLSRARTHHWSKSKGRSPYPVDCCSSALRCLPSARLFFSYFFTTTLYLGCQVDVSQDNSASLTFFRPNRNHLSAKFEVVFRLMSKQVKITRRTAHCWGNIKRGVSFNLGLAERELATGCERAYACAEERK